MQYRRDLIYRSHFPNEPVLQAQLARTISYLPGRLLVYEHVTSYVRVCYLVHFDTLRTLRVMHFETFGLRSFNLRNVCRAYFRYFIYRNVNYPLALARYDLDL